MARATLISCLGLGFVAAAATGSAACLTDPNAAPLLAAIASALGGVAGNFATDLFKVLHRPVAERLLDGQSAIDENHRVAKALRLAQLKSLGVILDRFDGAWLSGFAAENRPIEISPFSEALKRFIGVETALAEQAGFSDVPLVDEDERVLRQAVLSALPDAFDESLAARRATGNTAALLESWDQLRTALEKAVLAEIALRTGLNGHELPSSFLSIFQGKDSPESWFDLFVRDAAFRLKENSDFERIWSAEQIALGNAIAKANAEVLAAINVRTQRIETVQADHGDMLRELLEAARGGGIFARAAEQGISEKAVRNIVERLGGQGIERDDLVTWLDNWIEAARLELGRKRNEDEAFEAAYREAERRFKNGLKDPSSALMEELVREEKAEARRQEEYNRRRISLLEEAIRFDELALNIEGVAPKLRMIAAIEGADEPDALGAWLFAKAGDYFERGDQKGINAALLIAIAVYRAALEEYTRERVPLDWAMTQNNLGTALSTLGERESGTARLNEAVEAYRAALEEWTRERVPLQWATTQNNLGNALRTLGERESGTARLNEAVEAYRAALEERTRERVPLHWAMTQNNLGTALSTLGERESGTARLNEAVEAFRSALEELTRERVPLQWEQTRNNLARCLEIIELRHES